MEQTGFELSPQVRDVTVTTGRVRGLGKMAAQNVKELLQFSFCQGKG